MKVSPALCQIETRTGLFNAAELNAAELNAVLNRMANQAMALLPRHSPVSVIGILRRGAPLAALLTHRMVSVHGLAPPLRLDLSVKRYADDLTLLHPDTRLTEQAQHAALDLKGYTLLLVDDVLYTGHSILKVLPYLLQKNPAAIRGSAWQTVAQPVCLCMPMWWASNWPLPRRTPLNAMCRLTSPISKSSY